MDISTNITLDLTVCVYYATVNNTIRLKRLSSSHARVLRGHTTRDCMQFSRSDWKWELVRSYWLLFDYQPARVCDFDEGNLKRSYGFSRNARFGEYGVKGHSLRY